MARTAEQRRLVDEHQGLVRAIAAKAKEGLAREIEFDDLVGYGTQGLLEAAERFDPARGATFATFAYYRIRGAIYDGLRTMGWLSRTEYARHRAAERTDAYLGELADRDAGARAAAPPGGASVEEAATALAEAVDAVATIFVTSLDALEGFQAADVDARPAPEQLERAQDASRVRRAMTRLPAKERHMIEAFYFRDKTLLDAGAELGLSKSWASRLHARAIELLRQALDELDP